MAGLESKSIWVVANWKSNKNIREALEWVSVVGPGLPRSDRLKIIVCPPFTDVEEVEKAVKVGNFPLMVGVQDLSPFEEGAYTGEEAASIMQDLVDLAILGHSERRENFAETDEIVALKVEEARKYNIIPLVCVQYSETPVPKGVEIIAYEPVFAVGSGHPDTPENAGSVAAALKAKHGLSVQILYGGSVTESNAASFVRQESLNGLLVGSASLDPLQFLKIIRSIG